jgi:hypothetical protein
MEISKVPNILVNCQLLEVKLCDFGYTFQESDPGGHLIRVQRDKKKLWITSMGAA